MRTMRTVLPFVLTGILLARSATPLDAQGSSEDREALRRIMPEYEAVWAKGNAKAIAAFYTTNVLFTSSGGETSVGRDTLESRFAEVFSGDLKGTTIRITPEPFVFVKPDVAIGHGRYEIRRGTEMLEDGRYLDVLVKQGGKWHTRALQEMVPVPPSAEQREERRAQSQERP